MTPSYADDTQLYLPLSRGNEPETILVLEKCCAGIKQWMTANRLKLNDAKTEVMLLGTKEQRKKVTDLTLNLGDASITFQQTSSVRNLGVSFDSDLSMKTHVTKMCQAAHYHLRNIGRVRKLLKPETCEILIHSLVISRIDYCNSLLLGAPNATIQRLQKMQNKAARLITLASPRDHIQPILKSLHWLPVKQRIQYKVACLVFKCLHNMAPLYLSEIIKTHVPTRSLRSGNQCLLAIPPHKLSLCDHAFAVGAPKLWNSLCISLRKSPDLKTFKKNLKTFLFKIFDDL